MTTNKSTRSRRIASMAAGAVLALATAGAQAFPFFFPTNTNTRSVGGEPLSGIALNNAFDPTVLFIVFVDVDVAMLPGTTDSGTSLVFDPVDVSQIDISGDVDLIYGTIDEVTNVFTPNGDQGTGVISFSMTNVQYDDVANEFFVDGPAAAAPGVPGDAFGSIELTAVTPNAGNPNPSGDFQSTPGFDESSQCSNFSGYMGSGALPDTGCFINLGLGASNANLRAVSFVPDAPIVGPLPALDCPIPGMTCVVGPSAALPVSGSLVGIFQHTAVDVRTDITPDNPDPLNAGCVSFWNGDLGCPDDPNRYLAFTPGLYLVPVPATLSLLALGLVMVGGARRRLA